MKKATIGRVQRRRRAGIRQAVPVLNLFADANFTGRRLGFRGNIGVRNLLTAFNFNDVLSSFQLDGDDVTLVLFEDINYRGRRLVFREQGDVETLADPALNFNDITSSFVMVNRVLTDAEIDTIQRTRRAPRNTAEVLRRTPARRVAKKKIVKRRLR